MRKNVSAITQTTTTRADEFCSAVSSRDVILSPKTHHHLATPTRFPLQCHLLRVLRPFLRKTELIQVPTKTVSDILDDNGTALVLYDEDLKPIATVKRPPHTRKAWFLKKKGISSSKHILLAK